ncbi:ligand-binding sensor domain-containing protein [Emticicia soli]|uniref:Two-component regulator propeller domain-containing protein n=1 Tax=Emticicia soli TaxID=2027878 RepID=A0ABW5J1V3_9BACT
MKPFIFLSSRITIASFLILIGTVHLMARQKDLHLSSNEIRKIAMQHWSAAEGLSQGLINDVAIDKWGYVWISTKEGLNRFDGNSFKVYRHLPTDPKSISDNYITSLLVDDKNKIWVGTFTNGLDYFDPGTETFTHITLNDLNIKGTGLHDVSSIQDAGNGRIMVRIGGDLRIIETNKTEKAFRIRNIEAVYPGINQISQNFFFNKTLICQANGSVWINDKEQIFRYSAKGLEQISFDNTLIKSNSLRKKMWENPYTKQMCLVVANSIFQYDSTANKFLSWLELPKPYTFSDLIFADQEGNIWTSYKNKFYLRIDYKTHSFELIQPVAIDSNDQTIMLNNKVDKQGNIWLGSNGWGLFKISPTNIFFKKINIYPQNKISYGWPLRISKNGINAFYDPGIISDWINKLDRSDLFQRGFKNADFDEFFAVDGDGNYWFGLVDLTKKRVVVIKMNALGEYTILKEKKIPSVVNRFEGFQPIFSDREGRIWTAVFTNEDLVKLYLFEKNTGKSREFVLPTTQKLLYSERLISDWAEDQDGTMWLATTIGLFALSPETGQWKVYTADGKKNKSLSLNKLLSIRIDSNQPQKYIWIGTEGGGLNRLDKSTGNINTYTIKNGLPNNVIYSIQSDKHNNLWLSTNNGLCLFNTTTLKCRNFDKSHGLEANEFNRYQFSQSKTGEMYLGGVGFSVYFNPEDFYKLSNPAKIVINGLKVLNQEIDIDNQDAQKEPIITKAIEYTKKITLHHYQSMVSFNFALLDLKNPASNYYRYKLVGLYNDWVDNSKKKEATFTNIDPGTYTFMVSGHNGDGVWSNPAQMELVIQPAWWQTWWFKAILFILSIYLLYVFLQYRVSKAVEMEKLRNRIAQDLHDEIGSTLSSLSIYSTALARSFTSLPQKQAEIIDKISDSTIDMMATMNDIVWSINPANDSFENMINRMRAYASSVTEATEIKLNFENNLNNDKVRITMLQRKNLYLIFKEAVNNSLKHSECSNLSIKLFMTDKKLSLLVIDNGKGIEDKNNLESKMGGNGIANMHSRSRESDGTIEIISQPQTGTSVRFSVNVS